MAKILLKTGETVELPFHEALEYIVANADRIQPQASDSPMPKRRLNS